MAFRKRHTSARLEYSETVSETDWATKVEAKRFLDWADAFLFSKALATLTEQTVAVLSARSDETVFELRLYRPGLHRPNVVLPLESVVKLHEDDFPGFRIFFDGVGHFSVIRPVTET